MSYAHDAVQHAREIRQRLMNPSPPKAKVIPIIQQQPIAAIVPINQSEPVAQPIVPPKRDVHRLDKRIKALLRLLEKLEIRRELIVRSNEPSIEAIMRATCDYFLVSMTGMQSERRDREIVRPRQVACYIATKLTTRSLPTIGRKMGGRDHTTIIASRRKIDELRVTDPDIERAVTTIMAQFEAK